MESSLESLTSPLQKKRLPPESVVPSIPSHPLFVHYTIARPVEQVLSVSGAEERVKLGGERRRECGHVGKAHRRKALGGRRGKGRFAVLCGVGYSQVFCSRGMRALLTWLLHFVLGNWGITVEVSVVSPEVERGYCMSPLLIILHRWCRHHDSSSSSTATMRPRFWCLSVCLLKCLELPFGSLFNPSELFEESVEVQLGLWLLFLSWSTHGGTWHGLTLVTVLWSCEGTVSPHLEIWWASAKPNDVLVLDPPWWQETLPVFPRLCPLRHRQSPWSLDASLTCCVSLYFLGRTVNLLFQLRLGCLGVK